MYQKKDIIKINALAMAFALAASCQAAPAAVFASEQETVATQETSDASAAEGATAGSTETAPAEEPAADPAESVAGALGEQETTVSDDAVMQIRIGYEFDDGSFDEWARGTGFLVGSRYILTDQLTADTTTESQLYKSVFESKREVYDKVGVSLYDETETEKHIKLYVTNNKGDSLGIKDVVYKNGIGILTLSSPSDGIVCVFAGNDYNEMQDGETVNVKYAGTRDDRCEVINATGTVKKDEDQTAGFTFDASLPDGGPVGAPVYNDDGCIVGMVSGTSGTITSFSLSSLEAYLSSNGIKYETEDSIAAARAAAEKERAQKDIDNAQAAVVDKTALEDAISKAEAVDSSKYTSETAAALEEALADGKKVDEDEGASQAQADAAAKKINSAYDSLEEGGITAVLQKLAGSKLFIAVVVIIALALIIPRMIKKSKSSAGQKGVKGKDNNTDTEVPDNTVGNMLAEMEKTDAGYDDSGLDMTNRTVPDRRVQMDRRSKALRYADDSDMDDDGVSVLDDDDGSSDTTLLNRNGKHAYLVREDNGKRIPIIRNNFLVGKERKKVDYCIGGDSSVSRVHCRLRQIGDEYYIEDLRSTNYTYVDGEQIPEYKPVYLQDGAKIRIADVDFEFHMS